MYEKRQFITGNGDIVSESIQGFTDYVNENGCKIPAHKDGIRMFRDAPFPEGMSYADKGRFAELCRMYLVGDSGVLGYPSKAGPSAMNALQIGELVGLDKRRAQSWVKKMCRLRVLHKIKATDGTLQYWVNPAFALKSGHRISISQFMVFRKELSPLLKPWAIEELNKLCPSAEPIFKCDAVESANNIISTI